MPKKMRASPVTAQQTACGRTTFVLALCLLCARTTMSNVFVTIASPVCSMSRVRRLVCSCGRVGLAGERHSCSRHNSANRHYRRRKSWRGHDAVLQVQVVRKPSLDPLKSQRAYGEYNLQGVRSLPPAHGSRRLPSSGIHQLSGQTANRHPHQSTHKAHAQSSRNESTRAHLALNIRFTWLFARTGWDRRHELPKSAAILFGRLVQSVAYKMQTMRRGIYHAT